MSSTSKITICLFSILEHVKRCIIRSSNHIFFLSCIFSLNVCLQQGFCCLVACRHFTFARTFPIFIALRAYLALLSTLESILVITKIECSLLIERGTNHYTVNHYTVSRCSASDSSGMNASSLLKAQLLFKKNVNNSQSK